ncbi:MAG: FkbM family methyltransferase [Bacteroidales bacterium]|nr:FkbM family methyltransferase [Bacteroidales bacterium]
MKKERETRFLLTFCKMINAFKNLLFAIVPDDFLFHLKKVHYLRKIRRTNEEDEDDLYMVRSIICNGDEALDIGANIGVYTKFLSAFTGPGGKVYSFEPIPETYAFLENNVRKLRLKNVNIFNLAVSDITGMVKMEVPRYGKTGDNFYEARIVSSSSGNLKTYDVECNTLDNLYAGYGFRPSFIKCDVEGFEWNVFKCAGKLLRECNPVLLIEINNDLNRPDAGTDELLKFLKQSGYELFIKQKNKLKAWQGEKRVNYYLLQEKHIMNLKAKDLIQE